jgi:hypothetical protein
MLAGLSERQAETDEDMSYKPWDSWDSEYLTFEEDDHYEGKTKLLYVQSKRKIEILAVIKWYGPWRQYCFYPMPETIWNKGCMEDVQTVIKALMDERKVKR